MFDKQPLIHRKDQFRELFSNCDEFHMIVMSGYLSVVEIVQCAKVCKQWNDLTEKGWNVFLINFNRSIGVTSKIDLSKDTVKLLFSFIKQWKSFRTATSVERFGFPQEDPGEDERTASLFLSPAFYNSLPYVQKVDERKLNHLEFIPKGLKGKNSVHTTISDDMWFSKTNPKFSINQIVWSQVCQMWEYEDYIFSPLIYFEGSQFGNVVFEKLFQVEPIGQSISNLEENFNTPHSYHHSEYEYLMTSHDYYSTYIHQKRKQIFRTEKFHLKYIDSSNLVGFSTEELIEGTPSQYLSDHFNDQLQRLLFQVCFRSRLFAIRFVRNFVLKLFIHLTQKRYQSHTIKFTDSINDSCPEHKAIEGVEQWLNEYKANNQGSEIIASYVREDLVYHGAQCGEGTNSYLVVLNLKPGENQTCSFEFVTYEYYKYRMFGDILS